MLLQPSHSLLEIQQKLPHAPAHAGGCPAKKLLCGEGPGGPDRQQADHDPAMLF